MADSDTHKTMTGQSSLPPQPAQAFTAQHVPDFPPQYEAEVNENLRKFGQLEGQVLFDQSEASTPKSGRSTRRKILIIGLPIFIALALTSGAVIAIALSKHEKGGAHAAPSQAANDKGPNVVSQSTRSITVTEHITTTNMATTTILTTQTVSASIPSSIADAASSFFDQQKSEIDKAVSSISEALHPTFAPTISTTTITVSAKATSQKHTKAAPTSATSTSSSTTESSTTTSHSSVPTKETSRSGPIGFCGAPGTPCLIGRNDYGSQAPDNDLKTVMTVRGVHTVGDRLPEATSLY